MNTFLVNTEFINKKIREKGVALSKWEQTGNISPQTIKKMTENRNDRFRFESIRKVAELLKTSVSHLIKANEEDRNKELDLQKLETAMELRKINKKNLGIMSCTDTASVSAYFNGKKKPSVEIAYLYAVALGVEPRQILKDKEQKNMEVQQTELFLEEEKPNINEKVIRIIDCLVESLVSLRDELNED